MDNDAERKYNFKLKESLIKARNCGLLLGYTVLVTPSVKPGPRDMKSNLKFFFFFLVNEHFFLFTSYHFMCWGKFCS